MKKNQVLRKNKIILIRRNKEEVKEMRKEHKEEIGKMSEALNNNTEALIRLTDKLDKEK